jgi:hypothetical protein
MSAECAKHHESGVYVKLQKLSTMTSNDILDVAILVTEHLLDKAPELLSPDVLEVDGKYTELTFHLQDSIEDALAEIIKQ